MQLFYQEHIRPEDKNIVFTKDESRHIAKVLRKQEGDILHVTNGKGYLFIAEILQASSSQCLASIQETKQETPKPYGLHLAVAPTKMNDRFEWFLEKATEIGIDSITPILCDHSERKRIKPERYERVLQSAMKQSLHYRLPQLNPLISFSEFVEKNAGENCFIAHCEETNKKLLSKSIPLQQNYTLLIGPEGDFSTSEIELALEKKFLPVSLGNTRLRTETAAIVAAHTFAMLHES
ncbi:16S rRNA (uracil(1498)-N(3))-methyltransferase [Mesonia sp. MT50]|uniref:Ribosomal RNA small subunit methyltransferase E n=1 Tax=Mesonia profundi TaxID=3070998 RepID=A0ABU1A3P0_9FLAO|nr:16S rRNA (uracil(1498)-N(3))-methyltransferase [Mesonia profundi]MDQ7917291.1 16S rRNA (uracil(1498)-N(3))-methyltransferase [Mesonia profundi]